MSSSRSSVKARPSSARRPTVARLEERRKAGRRRRWIRFAALLLVVAAVGTGVWAVYFSRWFAVTKVEVVGTHRLTVAQVERAAEVPMGRPIVRLDTATVQRHVAGLTVVASVVVTTEWPHTVRITVVERQPVAVARAVGGGFRLLDSDGVDLGAVASQPATLPLLSLDPSATDPATLRAAATVAASLTPALESKIRSISALTANSVVLVLKSGATVRWGDASQGAIKAKVLAALMKRAAKVYDVSAPYAPTTAKG
jgi:cell division protein FtsQ